MIAILIGTWSVAVGQPRKPPASAARPSRIDAAPLLKIEQTLLPPALVVGLPAQEDLPAYFAAANPQLRDRLERIRKLYEAGSPRPYRAITLVAGDAGIGKTFLKKEVFSKKYPAEAVFKFDIREQYEQWQKEGTVQRKPDLQSGDIVINTLLATTDPQDRPFSQLLSAHSACFYVIDSLDEVHPNDYLKTLQQIEEFAFSTNNDFVHVVVFGRPCAFIQYWQGTNRQQRARDIELFMLSSPQFRTTGDLLVSSWNYALFKLEAGWSLPDGKSAPLTLNDYMEWSNEGFARSGRFQDIAMKESQEITPRVQDALVQYAQQYRTLGPPLNNLAGNSIIRDIVARQVLHDMPFDEHKMMAAYFDAWLERDYESDGRPSYAHPEHVELYLQLLEQIAVKYLAENRVDGEGFFAVSDSDQIRLTQGGRQLSFPVQRILDRSGMEHFDPRQIGPLKYRFEPIWLHRFLVEQYNDRLGAGR